MSTRYRPPPFHPARPGLVAPARIDPTGATGPTRAEARGKRWRRSSRGLYVPADVPLTPEQRIVEAAALIPARSRAAVTGWAALRWLGPGRWLNGSTPGDPHGLPVHLAMPIHGIRHRPGVHVCEEDRALVDFQMVDGLSVTTPVCSTAYAMRHAPSVRSAVETFCLAAYDDLVSYDELTAFAGMAPRLGESGVIGMPKYREAMQLVSENVWSPQEVTMMLIWMLDARLPRPLMNQPVFDRQGRHVATPDLLDVEAGVVGEYNGALHLDGRQHARDRRREDAMRDLGLEPFTMLAGDLGDRPAMADRMLAARRRARWQPQGERAWTIEPPSWWIPTVTVEQRRALTPDQRARLLGHRLAA